MESKSRTTAIINTFYSGLKHHTFAGPGFSNCEDLSNITIEPGTCNSPISQSKKKRKIIQVAVV